MAPTTTSGSGWLAGGEPPNRTFVLVAEWLYLQFWSEWVAIDRRWPFFDPNPLIAKLRESARDDLRAWLRANLVGAGGPYLIPV